VACAELLFMDDELARRTNLFPHRVGAKTDHSYAAGRAGLRRRCQHVTQHRPAAHPVQHLRYSRLHPRTLACGKNHRNKFCHSSASFVQKEVMFDTGDGFPLQYLDVISFLAESGKNFLGMHRVAGFQADLDDRLADRHVAFHPVMVNMDDIRPERGDNRQQAVESAGAVDDHRGDLHPASGFDQAALDNARNHVHVDIAA
jgi:hypothetical protein